MQSQVDSIWYLSIIDIRLPMFNIDWLHSRGAEVSEVRSVIPQDSGIRVLLFYRF